MARQTVWGLRDEVLRVPQPSRPLGPLAGEAWGLQEHSHIRTGASCLQRGGPGRWHVGQGTRGFPAGRRLRCLGNSLHGKRPPVWSVPLLSGRLRGHMVLALSPADATPEDFYDDMILGNKSNKTCALRPGNTVEANLRKTLCS